MRLHITPRARTFCILLAAVLLLIAIGVAAAELEDSFKLYADFTPSRRYSLTQETRSVLAGLRQDVLIYTCYEQGKENEQLAALLGNYSDASDAINVTTMEPDANSAFLEKFDSMGKGVSSGTIIVTNSDYSRFRALSDASFTVKNEAGEPIADRTEQKITSAIAYVDTGTTVTAQFLSGHRETDLSLLGKLSSLLENLGYDVSVIDLLRSSTQLDPACDILVVVSPKSDLSNGEYLSIMEFLDNGGSMILLMDNATYEQDEGMVQLYMQDRANFDKLLSRFSLRLNRDILVGADTAATNLRATSLMLRPAEHAITHDIEAEGYTVMFSEASSISAASSREASVTALLTTDSSCYAKDIDVSLSSLARAEDDNAGTFLVGALSQRRSGNLALFSSSSFVSGDEMTISGNSALMEGTMTTMRSAGVEVPSKSMSSKGSFRISSQDRGIIALVFQFLLPMLVLAGGAAIFLHRRKL